MHEINNFLAFDVAFVSDGPIGSANKSFQSLKTILKFIKFTRD